ncbi:MAG TPA: PPC domain-containing protein [Pirellulales bacterium]|nr:PPC domain-containing protein [Pirellulales bacterium]
MPQLLRPPFWAFVVLLAAAGVARADLPSTRLNRIVPLGGAAGTSLEMQVSAADGDEAKQLVFDHPGLKAEWIDKGKFKVTISADVPEGTYDVRLLGPFGMSNPRLFAVSHGLVDLAEKEPNDVPSAAQPTPINTAVSGTSDSNGQDFYRFAARQGQRLTIDCQAGKLDSEVDACLSVVAADGAVLATSGDYHGRDPFIDFIAPADGEYLVEVHDLSFRGGFPYRLIVTDRPYVENVFPRVVEPGKPVELTALGRNFGTAGQPSNWKIDERPLQEFRFTITPPSAAEAFGFYRFVEHPTDHTVLPTAATCTLDGFQVRVPVGEGASPPVTLMYASGPVTLEREPNDMLEQPQPVALPLTVSGRFDRPRDADWFEIEPAEAGRYEIQAYSERIAGQADPYVVVVDDKGTRINEIDDFGHRMNAFDGHLRDPVGSVDLQAGRKYRLLVQDRYGRGGARYQYVLTVHRSQPDFFVAAIHGVNPGPSGISIWRGGATWLDLIFHRQDGYGGPITVQAEGLPPGLHAEEVKIPNDTRAALVLWADADAPLWNGTFKLVATGKRGDATLRREVRPYTRVWTDANMGSSRPTRELAAAIIEKAPYGLRAAPDRATVEMNNKLTIKVAVDRLWPEFQAAVKVIGLGLPGGFQFSEREIAAGQNEGEFELQVGNMRPGEYTITLLGQGQVPVKKDATSQPANTLVAIPCRPLTITVVEKPK